MKCLHDQVFITIIILVWGKKLVPFHGITNILLQEKILLR